MKSKIHTQQENNFKRVSKATFIHLGILVAMISNSAFANHLSKKQNYQESNLSEMIFVSLSNGTKFKKTVLESASDTIKTWNANYKKTIEEVIAEDNKIIESDIDNNTSLDLESTIEEVIKEDNLIIESNIKNEVFPLDFNSIYKAIANVLQT